MNAFTPLNFSRPLTGNGTRGGIFIKHFLKNYRELIKKLISSSSKNNSAAPRQGFTKN